MPLRDEKLPLDVLRRVMPRRPDQDPPRESTLLEVFTGTYWDVQEAENQARTERLQGDGDRRS